MNFFAFNQKFIFALPQSCKNTKPWPPTSFCLLYLEEVLHVTALLKEGYGENVVEQAL
jgi:hypothetical protein